MQVFKNIPLLLYCFQWQTSFPSAPQYLIFFLYCAKLEVSQLFVLLIIGCVYQVRTIFLTSTGQGMVAMKPLIRLSLKDLTLIFFSNDLWGTTSSLC